MRWTGLAAALAGCVLGGTQARAQSPVAIDAGRVAASEVRLRADFVLRITACEFMIPALAGMSEPQIASRMRTQIETAQACWNAFPSVLGGFALARLFELAGDAAGSEAAVAAVQARYPGSQLVLVGLAGQKARAGDLEAAGALIDQAIAAGPPEGDRDPDNWTQLAKPLLEGDAVIPLRLRIYDEAWRRSEQRRDRDEKVRILTARAGVLLDAERHADALADLDRAMPYTSDSDRDTVLLLRARAKQALGDAEGARADFAAAVALAPQVASSEASHRRQLAADAAPPECRIAARKASGMFTEADGDVDATMSAGEECIAAGHAAMGLALKASERVRLGDRSAAMALLDEATAADPAYSYAYAVRGAAHYAAERYAESLAAFDRAIELDAQNPRYVFARALTRVRLGDREGARADQERGLGLDPRQSSEVAEYVRNLIAMGDHRCALDAIDRARDFLLPSSEVLQMRPMVWREVNKFPRAERACANPVAYGQAFMF